MKCGDVKEGDCLISTDSNKLRIAETPAAAAYAVGATYTPLIPPVGVHGAQLPKPVVAAFQKQTFSAEHLVPDPHQGGEAIKASEEHHV
jgi:hypothetical protein